MSNWLISHQIYILIAMIVGVVCFFKAPAVFNLFLRLAYLAAVACLFVYMGYIIFNVEAETWQWLGISLFSIIGMAPIIWILSVMFEKDEPEDGKTIVISGKTKFKEIPDGVYKDVNGTTRIKFGNLDEPKQ